MSWHMTVVSLFVVGMSVFVVSHWDETSGWVYVFMLLLGFILVENRLNNNNFTEQLYASGFKRP